MASKRERRLTARRARERERRWKEVKWGWIAFGIWFAIMFVATLFGREGWEWTALWIIGGTVTTTIAVWRTMRWWQVR